MALKRHKCCTAGPADSAECRIWLPCVRRVANVSAVAADGWEEAADNANTKAIEPQSTGGFAQTQRKRRNAKRKI